MNLKSSTLNSFEKYYPACYHNPIIMLQIKKNKNQNLIIMLQIKKFERAKAFIVDIMFCLLLCGKKAFCHQKTCSLS